MLLNNLDTERHNDFPRLIRLMALTGGLIQIVAPLAMLLLPVFATCLGDTCSRQSYIQMGGGPLGYAILLGTILLGLAVVMTNLNHNVDKRLKRRVLWAAVVGSLIASIVAAWSIGLAFVPGGFILFTALYFDSRKANPAS